MTPMSPAQMLRVFLSWRMLVAFVMGFACGLPLLLTGSVLQAWMAVEGVDLATIGLFSLVGLPYTVKFLWAPLLDRYTPALFGRRRGWLLIAQVALIASLIFLGLSDPGQNLWLVALLAFLVTFFSASQDIVVDAFRREDLADEELGLGSSLYVNGYRVGMLLAGSGGLILSDFVPFSTVYLLMGLAMILGLIVTLLAREPKVAAGTPTNLKEAVVEPFRDYFQRPEAMLFLLFILLYKVGDAMASNMTMPFYLEMGFTRSQIGTVVQLFGFWATIAGGLAGGLLILRWGIYRSLWAFGILQGVSTACFVVLLWTGSNVAWLAGVIAFENVSSGMGTAAFVAFMASLTNKRFTATQYALLSSLMGIPRVVAGASTGYLVEIVGWFSFFTFCALLAIPGLLLLRRFAVVRNARAVAASA